MIHEYIFLIALGLFVTEFEPFKLIANYIYTKSGNKTYLEYIFGVFDCWQCSTFWASLIWTWDIKSAIIASFIVYVLNTIQDQWILRRRA